MSSSYFWTCCYRGSKTAVSLKAVHKEHMTCVHVFGLNYVPSPPYPIILNIMSVFLLLVPTLDMHAHMHVLINYFRLHIYLLLTQTCNFVTISVSWCKQVNKIFLLLKHIHNAYTIINNCFVSFNCLQECFSVCLKVNYLREWLHRHHPHPPSPCQ